MRRRVRQATSAAMLLPLLQLYLVGPVLGGLGWIMPKTPILRLVNQSYEISCTLNRTDLRTQHFTSQDLRFHVQNVPVPKERVIIVNETTIKLVVPHAPAGKTSYICMLDSTTGIDMRSVYVGYPPQNVSDFKCRSDNWQNMNCSFRQPFNPIPCDYKLHFHFKSFGSDFTCDLTPQLDQTYKCSVDLSTSYRQSHEWYTFVLVSSNEFGENKEIFEINNFDSVIPEAPSECRAEAITSNSVVLKWSISYKLQTFKRDFAFDVKMLSSFDNKVWKTVDTSEIVKNLTDYTLHVNNLLFADTPYDVRIRMRTATAEDVDDMWSNYSSCLFNTLPRRPDNPPETAIGGFEINAYERNAYDIYIYWKELPKHQHNSMTGFQYKIAEIRRNGALLQNVIEARNGSGMIQYRNMTDGNYTFTIRSSNSVGDSVEVSKLFIPSRAYRVAKPKIIKLLSDAGKYRLSWQPVLEDASKITSYTVFWCNSSSNSPNDCNGSIKFDYVNGTSTSYELNKVTSTLNFAVAANAGELSSGMVWASCTATQKKDIGKLKSIWIPSLRSTYIDLEWKLECGDSAIVEGYIIAYCPIVSLKSQICKTNEELVNVTAGPSVSSYRISNLKPYVMYKMEIAMYSKTRVGPRSEPLYNVTHGAAPSPPRDLVCVDIKNNSLTLQWKPPLQINGGTMNYEIWYNTHHNKIDVVDFTSNVTYVLDNLEPFTNYKIIVRAYTVAYSNNSNTLDVTTAIGTPGIIQQPGSRESNDSRVSIVWQAPKKPAGCLEYYEFKIKPNRQSGKEARITRLRGRECRLTRSICQLSTKDSDRDFVSTDFQFFVRAVNVILSGHTPHYDRWRELSCEARMSYYAESGLSNMQHLQYHHHHHREVDNIDCELDSGDIIPYINWTRIDPFATILPGEWSQPLAHWCNYRGGDTAPIVFLTALICFGVVCTIICSYLTTQKMRKIKNIKVVLPDALNDIVTSEKSNAAKEREAFNGHDNYNELLGKCPDDTFLPYGTDMHDVESIGSVEETPDNEEEVHAAQDDLMSLSDEYKYSMHDDTELGTQEEEVAVSDPAIVENILNFASSGYVAAPAPKPAPNGYVQAPPPKAATLTTTSNYISPSVFTGIGSTPLTKTPIIVSTDADGISGYVTHKQLSDYGHKLQ